MARNKRSVERLKKIPSLWIRLGVIILVLVVAGAIFLHKITSQEPELQTAEMPEAQLDRLLEEGKPIFLFVHSNNCYSCIEMMKVVDQVYPDYAPFIEIVDVDVYDPRNANLLRRANIYAIPTQVFINRFGMGEVAMGLMKPEQLRQQLDSLIEKP